MTRNATDDLQQFLDDLTPEQREAIGQATAQDWMNAIGTCVKDPAFWGTLATSFFQGMVRGFERDL